MLELLKAVGILMLVTPVAIIGAAVILVIIFLPFAMASQFFRWMFQ